MTTENQSSVKKKLFKEFIINTRYWRIYKGDMEVTEEWNENINYKVGDVVLLDDQRFEAIKTGRGFRIYLPNPRYAMSKSKQDVELDVAMKAIKEELNQKHKRTIQKLTEENSMLKGMAVWGVDQESKVSDKKGYNFKDYIMDQVIWRKVNIKKSDYIAEWANDVCYEKNQLVRFKESIFQAKELSCNQCPMINNPLEWIKSKADFHKIREAYDRDIAKYTKQIDQTKVDATKYMTKIYEEKVELKDMSDLLAEQRNKAEERVDELNKIKVQLEEQLIELHSDMQSMIPTSSLLKLGTLLLVITISLLVYLSFYS